MSTIKIKGPKCPRSPITVSLKKSLLVAWTCFRIVVYSRSEAEQTCFLHELTLTHQTNPIISKLLSQLQTHMTVGYHQVRQIKSQTDEKGQSHRVDAGYAPSTEWRRGVEVSSED